MSCAGIPPLVNSSTRSGSRSAPGVGLVRSSTMITALRLPLAISDNLRVPIGRERHSRMASTVSAGSSRGPISISFHDAGKSIVKSSSPNHALVRNCILVMTWAPSPQTRRFADPLGEGQAVSTSHPSSAPRGIRPPDIFLQAKTPRIVAWTETPSRQMGR